MNVMGSYGATGGNRVLEEVGVYSAESSRMSALVKRDQATRDSRAGSRRGHLVLFVRYRPGALEQDPEKIRLEVASRDVLFNRTSPQHWHRRNRCLNAASHCNHL